MVSVRDARVVGEVSGAGLEVVRATAPSASRSLNHGWKPTIDRHPTRRHCVTVAVTVSRSSVQLELLAHRAAEGPSLVEVDHDRVGLVVRRHGRSKTKPCIACSAKFVGTVHSRPSNVNRPCAVRPTNGAITKLP